jgi:hypothetical protein
MNLPPDFRELLEEFAREGVEHVVIGGYARNAVPATWQGTPIRVIGLDDLIANKRAAGRAQDLVDVVKLERVRAKLTT